MTQDKHEDLEMSQIVLQIFVSEKDTNHLISATEKDTIHL